MILKKLTAIAAFTTLISCNYTPRQNSATENTPKALSSETSSFDLVSKRGYDDLLESLYKELLDQDPDLKSLEGKIDSLSMNKGDSTRGFLEFNQKNQSYFNAASAHNTAIKDSVLKAHIAKLITNSLSEYNTTTSKHNKLISIIDSNSSTINDLHLALKIVKTLPMIGKYQHDHLPGTQPLNHFAEEQNRVIKLVNATIKK